MSMWEDYRDDALAEAAVREIESRRTKKDKKKDAKKMTLTTRRPTGIPTWPMALVAGPEKTGKTYTAAQASCSEHIGRTFWLAFGEDDPDEYGAMPGARIEIVDHDGSPAGLLAAIRAASAEPMTDGKPNLIVLDSGTRLWNALSDLAQLEADQRAKAKAERYGRKAAPDGESDISMDLWNRAKTRHARIAKALHDHHGPVIITARMEETTVIVDGKPAKDGAKTWKIQTEKTLPYDVGAIVRIPERGSFQLQGVRSLRLSIGEQAQTVPDFSMELLWERMGCFDAQVSTRHQTTVLAEDIEDERVRILAELSSLYDTEDRWQAIDAWWMQKTGTHLAESDDLPGLRDLASKAREQKARAAAQQTHTTPATPTTTEGEAA